MTALRVEDVARDYGHGSVLDGLSFSLEQGETLAVIGPSGCGKSTLLSLLAGLAAPDRGRIVLPGARDPAPGRAGFIPQDGGLFPWKTVRDHLALPLTLRGDAPAIRNRAVRAMLEALRLTGLEDRYPDRISGGQRQRVAIGRALIAEPDVLLMDEPFSSLDAITREHMQELVLDLWKIRRLTVVLVTHSAAEAVFLGRRIMVLGELPARVRLWVDNPWFGDPRCREHDGAFALARHIQAALPAGGEAACAR